MHSTETIGIKVIIYYTQRTHTHETNGTQPHARTQGIPSPQKKRWVLRADLNDAVEEECRGELVTLLPPQPNPRPYPLQHTVRAPSHVQSADSLCLRSDLEPCRSVLAPHSEGRFPAPSSKLLFKNPPTHRPVGFAQHHPGRLGKKEPSLKVRNKTA